MLRPDFFLHDYTATYLETDAIVVLFLAVLAFTAWLFGK